MTNTGLWPPQPQIVPAGTLLFNSNRTGNQEIWTSDYVGTATSLRRLTTDPRYDTWQPMVSPNRSRIAVNRSLRSSLGNNQMDSPAGLPFSELWVMNANGTGLTKLLGPANTIQNPDASFWNLLATPHWIDDNTLLVAGGPTANAISAHAAVVLDAWTGQIISMPYNAGGAGADVLDPTPVYRTPGAPQVNDTTGSCSVAAGSTGVNVNTFAGAGTLNVDGTTTGAGRVGFPNYGTIRVQTANGPCLISYTGRGATTFTGCALIGGGSGVLATGGIVEGVPISQSGEFLFAWTATIIGIFRAPLHQIDPTGAENGPFALARVTQPVTDGFLLDNDPAYDPFGKWAAFLRKYDVTAPAGTWGIGVVRANVAVSTPAHHLIGPAGAAPDIVDLAGNITSRPAFSPDGKTIFSHRLPVTPTLSGDAVAGGWHIVSMAFAAATGSPPLRDRHRGWVHQLVSVCGVGSGP